MKAFKTAKVALLLVFLAASGDGTDDQKRPRDPEAIRDETNGDRRVRARLPPLDCRLRLIERLDGEIEKFIGLDEPSTYLSANYSAYACYTVKEVLVGIMQFAKRRENIKELQIEKLIIETSCDFYSQAPILINHLIDMLRNEKQYDVLSLSTPSETLREDCKLLGFYELDETNSNIISLKLTARYELILHQLDVAEAEDRKLISKYYNGLSSNQYAIGFYTAAKTLAALIICEDPGVEGVGVEWEVKKLSVYAPYDMVNDGPAVLVNLLGWLKEEKSALGRIYTRSFPQTILGELYHATGFEHDTQLSKLYRYVMLSVSLKNVHRESFCELQVKSDIGVSQPQTYGYECLNTNGRKEASGRFSMDTNTKEAELLGECMPIDNKRLWKNGSNVLKQLIKVISELGAKKITVEAHSSLQKSFYKEFRFFHKGPYGDRKVLTCQLNENDLPNRQWEECGLERGDINAKELRANFQHLSIPLKSNSFVYVCYTKQRHAVGYVFGETKDASKDVLITRIKILKRLHFNQQASLVLKKVIEKLRNRDKEKIFTELKEYRNYAIYSGLGFRGSYKKGDLRTMVMNLREAVNDVNEDKSKAAKSIQMVSNQSHGILVYCKLRAVDSESVVRQLTRNNLWLHQKSKNGFASLAFACFSKSGDIEVAFLCEKSVKETGKVYISQWYTRLSSLSPNSLKHIIQQLIDIFVELNMSEAYLKFSDVKAKLEVYKLVGFTNKSADKRSQKSNAFLYKDLNSTKTRQEASSSAVASTNSALSAPYGLSILGIDPQNLAALAAQIRNKIEVYKVQFNNLNFPDLEKELKNHYVACFYSPNTEQYLGFIFYAEPLDGPVKKNSDVYINMVVTEEPYLLKDHASQMMEQLLQRLAESRRATVRMMVYNETIRSFYGKLAYKSTPSLPQMTFYLYTMRHYSALKAGTEKNHQTAEQRREIIQEILPMTKLDKKAIKERINRAQIIGCFVPSTQQLAGFLLYKVEKGQTNETIKLVHLELDADEVPTDAARQLISNFLNTLNDQRGGKRATVTSTLRTEAEIDIIAVLMKCGFEASQEHNDLVNLKYLFNENTEVAKNYCSS